MIKSFKHAIDGVKTGLFYERNISIITIAAFITIYTSIYYKLSPVELSIIILISIVVISIELINLTLEKKH